MKTFWLSCGALSLGLLPATAQQAPRHELLLGGGPHHRIMLDRQASPLVYQAKGPAFQLRYTHYAPKSRLVLDLNARLGRDLPRRYGVRLYGNDARSYAIQSAYYEARLGLSYLRRLAAPTPKLSVFVGAGLQEQLQISDAVANLYWGLSVAGLYAQGRAEYALTPHHHLTAELAVPALAAVTRHTYANYPKSTDENNLPAFFHQGTRLTSLHQLQQVQATVRYHYALGRHLRLGTDAQFGWLHYPRPQPIRSYDWRLGAQLGYAF